MSKLGTATVKYTLSDAGLSSAAEAAGFYAVAYEWNGQTVISYRGTNNPDPLATASDMWNGWTLGAGFDSAQRRNRGREFRSGLRGTHAA